MGSYRISQLAEQVGLPATTLRYYETQGILPAERNAAGYRIYDDSHVERVRFIATAKDLGLPLDRIRDLLGVWQHGMCREVRGELTPLIRAQIEGVEHQIARLGDFRDHLSTAAARLDALPDRDDPCDPSCAFIKADAPVSLPLARPPQPTATLSDSEPPVACSLTNGEYVDRRSRWRAVLGDVVREQLSDGGIRMVLPVENAEPIAALVASESRCCPFFVFRLTFGATGVELIAHAPAEAGELLADLVAVEEVATA